MLTTVAVPLLSAEALPSLHLQSICRNAPSVHGRHGDAHFSNEELAEISTGGEEHRFLMIAAAVAAGVHAAT